MNPFLYVPNMHLGLKALLYYRKTFGNDSKEAMQLYRIYGKMVGFICDDWISIMQKYNASKLC